MRHTLPALFIAMKNVQLTKEQIISKLESYCSYRERCETEVKQKLYLLGVKLTQYDDYINYLKENNYLNEDRFALSFARGKFSIKSWGKRKIELELQEKKIDKNRITKSIQEIDNGMYFLRLQDILLKKSKTIKETDKIKRKYKLMQFALQKGYEPELIQQAIKIILL